MNGMDLKCNLKISILSPRNSTHYIILMTLSTNYPKDLPFGLDIVGFHAPSSTSIFMKLSGGHSDLSWPFS